MTAAFKILSRSLVKRFYKENAGLFVFVFTMMFFIVSKVDGAGLYEYHYSLVTGMLRSKVFLLLVFFLWFLYTRKYAVFISGAISSPYYSFFNLYNQLNIAHRFRLFFATGILLLLPVILYSIFICFVGFQQHLYWPVGLSMGYLLLLCCLTAGWHIHLLDNANKTANPAVRKKRSLPVLSAYYFTLLRFVAGKQINIWTGIKVFTCGVLYLTARNNNTIDRDLSMPYLFYSLGILANGILIFRVRIFEESYLSFYRMLPVSLERRLLQYALFYFFLLIPECITVSALTPAHLNSIDAINFILSGFSLLLLMHSFSFLKNFSIKDYIALLFVIFLIEYILLITLAPCYMYIIFFIMAIIIFYSRYYKFESGLRD
ncbi:hypothetical protein [Parafilimonas sp.]|uniref:hypothetical protein n=1 Tax=Parafilimonas sp. TaxID=1969739 RepID=UPI0039E31BAB